MKVLGIGELLWDLFPDGPRLGGAPFNVAANLRRLGHRAAFVSAVGDDKFGREAMAAAEALGVETFIDVVGDLPTGTVRVVPERSGGHRFEVRSPAAYDEIGATDGLGARLASWGARALVFGTLAQRSPRTSDLTRQTASGSSIAERLYDVNLREGCWTPELVTGLLPLATIVKVNEAEAAVVARCVGSEVTTAGLGERLARDHGVRVTCVTRGADGAEMWLAGGVHRATPVRVEVVDTVGAGDAFAAGLLHGFLEGRSPRDSLELGNRLGALVASRLGALPAWTPEEAA